MGVRSKEMRAAVAHIKNHSEGRSKTLETRITDSMKKRAPTKKIKAV